ncbi:hypothetical protein, partial [Liquorilactobacillus vini]
MEVKSKSVTSLLNFQNRSNLAESLYIFALVIYVCANYMFGTFLTRYFPGMWLVYLTEFSGIMMVLKITFFDHWSRKD